jgi:tetratricopeptide (TPR) repeat protein
MSADERLAFEAQMQSDAFLADAVEGFSTDPGAIDDIPRYGNTGKSWLYTIAGLGLVGLLLFTAAEVFFIQELESDLVEDIVMETKVPEPQQPTNAAESPALLLDEELTMEPILEPAQAEEELVVPTFEERRTIKSFVKPMDILDAPAISLIPSEIALYKSDIIFIEDLKIAREVLLQSELDKPIYFHHRHVPALRENPENPLSNLQEKYLNQFRELTYRESLTLGLRAYNQGDYQKSQSTFIALSKEYGSSINHHFYTGLCAFHLEDYEMALKEFGEARSMYDASFFEEATWYYALSLQASGMKKEAKKLFEEIYKGDGHYAPMAASRLLREN